MSTFFISILSNQVESKSRKTFTLIPLACLLLAICFGLSGCGNDEIQLPNKKLEGKINGEDWSSDKANAYTFSTDFKYEVKLLSKDEPGSDPCSAPSPSKPFLSAVFNPSEGSFSLGSILVDPNQVIVRIHPNTSSEFIITNGFMEIYLIDNAQMFGYIQAILDDENTVEGSFEVRFCN